MTLIQEPRTRRFTRDEYYAMADLGMFEGQRVELIEGEILQMAPQNNAHYVAIDKVHEALRALFHPANWVRTQAPLNLADGSEPEPDVAVVRGTRDGYADHPTTAILVVEVSDTTLTYDRGRKARVYARAGIDDYWIVDLVHRQVEVRRALVQDAKGVWSYSDTRAFSTSEMVTPLAAPQGSIRVADLLP